MVDIILVAAGIVLIIISYIVSDKMDGAKEKKETTQVDIWTPKDEERVRGKIEAIIKESTEEAMIRTDDQLAQITNEKIMAVHEFSDQILEKIKQNHTEVIFLYDMLNEKDNEVKKLLQEVNSIRLKTEAQISQVSLAPRSGKPEEKKEQKTAAEKPKTAMAMLEESAKAKKTMTFPKPKKDVNQQAEQIRRAIDEAVNSAGDTAVHENKNAQILKLYEDGNSTVEIAKKLELGQGEVKLVVDLFLGTKEH